MKCFGYEFETLANQHHSGRSFRKASRWSQFVTMAMGQLAGRDSLRDILDNMSAQTHRLYHLGCAKLSRSNLSRINEDKPHQLYEALFGKLLIRCQRKLHVGLNHDGFLPEFVTVTDGKDHDVTIGRILNFPKGSIIAMDKGYNDYCWYKQLTDKGIFFVTRLKINAKYNVIKRHTFVKNKGLSSDETIAFSGVHTAKKCPTHLRRIGYKDAVTGKNYVFLTNNFKLAARTIADIYKARWQVELFFKWIKQNLKIKSFVGTSKNAVMTQIWIALCMYLLLCYLKFKFGLKKSMQQILRLLQMNLFEKRDLMALLRGEPVNDHEPDINQMVLL